MMPISKLFFLVHLLMPLVAITGAEANSIPDVKCYVTVPPERGLDSIGVKFDDRLYIAPFADQCKNVAAAFNSLDGVQHVGCGGMTGLGFLYVRTPKPRYEGTHLPYCEDNFEGYLGFIGHFDDGGAMRRDQTCLPTWWLQTEAAGAAGCQEVAKVLNGLNGVANVGCRWDGGYMRYNHFRGITSGLPIGGGYYLTITDNCEAGAAALTRYLRGGCALLAPGYSGPNCQIDGACQTGANGEACQHGDATGTGKGGCGCTCKAGYSGSNCETPDKCQAGLNGAVCQNQGSATGVTGGCGCACAPESAYSGPNCETADACKAGCLADNQAELPELHICPYTTDTCDDTTSLTLAECRVFSESIKRAASAEFYGAWNSLPSGCQFFSYPSEYQETVGTNRVVWNAFEGNEDMHNQMWKTSNMCRNLDHWCYASSSKRVCRKCIRDPTAKQLTSGVITGTLEEGSMGMGAVEAGSRHDAAKLPAAAASGCSNDSSDADIARTVFEGVIAICLCGLLLIAYTYSARPAQAGTAQPVERRQSDADSEQVYAPTHLLSSQSERLVSEL